MSRSSVVKENLPQISPKDLDDSSLLERLCSADHDVDYEEFVNRYYKSVVEECVRKCQFKNLDRSVGKDIAHQVFERVRIYKSFKKEKLKGDNVRHAILGWLYRIMIRLFYDYFNSSKKNLSNQNSFYIDEIINEVQQVDIKRLISKAELAKLILSKLSEKQKRVVILDIEYKRFHKYLPGDALEDLAQELGVEKSSIRKIRERAIAKIKHTLDELNG